MLVLPSLEDVPIGPELRWLIETPLRVVVLDRGDGPNANALRQAGWPIVALNVTHAVDLRAWQTLRAELTTYRPSFVHAFGHSALRLARFAQLRSHGCPLWFTEIGESKPGWLSRRFMKGVARIVKRDEPIAPLPAIGPFEVSTPSGTLIVTDGKFAARPEWVIAIRAFDFIKAVYPDAHFLLSGEGPLIEPLARYGTQIAVGDVRFRFVGPCSDLPTFFGRSKIVWVPAVQFGAAQRLVTAMAMGCAVVAVNSPELAKIVRHGETGFLFPQGDHVELTKLTRRLLDEPGLADRMGERAREYANEHFPVSKVVEAVRTLYHLHNSER